MYLLCLKSRTKVRFSSVIRRIFKEKVSITTRKQNKTDTVNCSLVILPAQKASLVTTTYCRFLPTYLISFRLILFWLRAKTTGLHRI